MRLMAYIDGGTGSFIIQAFIGTVVGLSYALRHHIGSLVGKLKRGKGSDSEKPTKDQS